MARPYWQPDQDIFAGVIKIVSDIFDVPESELTPNTHFVDDLDESLEIAATVAECEETFGLEIPDKEAQSLVTVGLLADHIERHLLPNADVWSPAPQCRRQTDLDTPY